ncbi:MAG: hypothetical protein P8179_20060 [Candidatus Thiodiazotropha sp.]
MKKPNNRNRLLWAVVGLLLLTICAFAVYKAQPILFPKIKQSAKVDPHCDLRAGPCVSDLGQGIRVSFGIKPKEIPLLKPIKLHVSIVGLQVDKVQVDFSGVDMNMGFNRVTLNPLREGVFQGDGMIPVCVRDAMEWEANVLISTHEHGSFIR